MTKYNVVDINIDSFNEDVLKVEINKKLLNIIDIMEFNI